MLTKEYILHLFDYDYERGILIWKNPPKFHSQRKGKIAGHIDEEGYHRVKIDYKHYKIHQLIWFLETGKIPEMVDHIDGDKLNNNILNLRDVTNRENQQNQNLHRAGHLPGTHWHKGNEKWIAQISINKKKKHLGTFSSEKEAHNAYVNALSNL